ncbi:hypothetical protein [Paracoccus benzoatiresistens]|uniref:Uncharacterized protein n=1 Tax=Paracoccus benzoatiresistens TaxID=2997341 RepID=A0ABT4J9Y1_9RHOB|nr:hypothetical protein [Paracoccus sp. EF6]MCZ0963937.1 hypothetical protein [Paracoccus sp. EF6]
MIAMKGKGFPGGLAEPFDKRINKGTVMRMISAGMQGNCPSSNDLEQAA